MPINKNQLKRLIILDQLFTGIKRKYTLQELLEKVSAKLNTDDNIQDGISRRTLFNDFKLLKSPRNKGGFEAPIQLKDNKYSYSDSSYSIHSRNLGYEELAKLTETLQVLRQLEDIPIYGYLKDVVTKLEQSLELEAVKNDTILLLESRPKPVGLEWAAVIFEAIKKGTILTISYQPFGKPINDLDVKPYYLKEFNNRWFSLCLAVADDNELVLALDRIKKISPKLIYFKRNRKNIPFTYLDNIIGVSYTKGERLEEIILEVSKNRAPYIETKPIHHSQETIKILTNGSHLIKLKLIPNNELTALLLSFLPDVKILKPISLAERIKKIVIKYQNEAF